MGHADVRNISKAVAKQLITAGMTSECWPLYSMADKIDAQQKLMDSCEGKKKASVQDAIMKAIVQCQMSKEVQDSRIQEASHAEQSRDDRPKKRDNGDDKEIKPAKKAKSGNQQ